MNTQSITNATAMTATTFNGNLNGTALNATNVGITLNNIGAYQVVPVVNTAVAGNFPLNISFSGNNLLFNNASGTISCNAIISTLTGNASSATQVKTTSDATNATQFLTFSASNTGSVIDLRTDAGITCNPFLNSISATTFNGDLNGTASLATNISLGTIGDLLYQSASNVTSKITIGTINQILVSNGTIPVWTTPAAPTIPTLSQVLVSGNSAGSTSINMNSNAISAISTLGVNSTSTFGGTVTLNIGTGASATRAFILKESGGVGLSMLPNSTVGSYNPLIVVNDSVIFGDNTAIDTSDLVLTTWSATTSGVRITPTTALIGAGGTTATPTASVSCSGTTVSITGDPVVGNRNIVVDNTGGAITIGNGGSTATANIVLSKLTTATGTNFTTGNNTLIGPRVGNAMVVASANNTYVGDRAGILATGSNNTFIGSNAGQTVTTGANNICIGRDAAVPTITASNQIAIGTTAETMLIQGGHNWRFFTSGISANITLTFPFHQIYPIISGPLTITLPLATSAMIGAHFVFRKVIANAVITISSTGSPAIVPYNGLTAVASVTMTTNQFETEFLCNGAVYYQVNTDAPLTVAVADNNTSTTMYPIFTTATAGQKSLLFDSTTTPLRYKPDSSELSAQKFTVNGLNPVAGDNAGFIEQSISTSTTVFQNQATSGQIHLAVCDALNVLKFPLKVSPDDVSGTKFSVGNIVNPVTGDNAGFIEQNTGLSATTIQNQATDGKIYLSVRDPSNVISSVIVSSEDVSGEQFSVGNIVNPVAGDNAGYISQNIGASATTIQNQATSGLIRLITRNALSNAITTFQLSTTDLTTITTNNPTITGFTDPATSDSTSKIATTRWVQSALTSGVATATTVAVADDNSATTMYPVFTTATAGQKSLLFDSTTTPLRYKPDAGELSALQYSLGGIVNPVAGDNAGLFSQNTGSSATVIQNQATSGLIRLITRDAANLPTTALQISFANCNITTTNDPVIYARNILVDNGSTNPITIGNGSSTSTSNIIITSLSLASTRVFTAGGNVIIGPVAGNSLPVGATDNTFVGDSAGGTTSGSRNICIGYNSQVPTVANSNQIAIGTVAETLYVRGGFNWRVGAQITSTATGNLATAVLAQFYTVAMSAAAQTIALPNPTTAAYLGARVTFKRKTNTTVFTITSTGGAGFVPIGSIALSASPISIAATVFQVDLVCDGVNWCIIGQA
jgi:hypothetical protein